MEKYQPFDTLRYFFRVIQPIDFAASTIYHRSVRTSIEIFYTTTRLDMDTFDCTADTSPPVAPEVFDPKWDHLRNDNDMNVYHDDDDNDDNDDESNTSLLLPPESYESIIDLSEIEEDASVALLFDNQPVSEATGFLRTLSDTGERYYREQTEHDESILPRYVKQALKNGVWYNGDVINIHMTRLDRRDAIYCAIDPTTRKRSHFFRRTLCHYCYVQDMAKVVQFIREILYPPFDGAMHARVSHYFHRPAGGLLP
jgi:hypothetical protein